MSYLALYRKYRPRNFSDLVGQSELANIIKNEILNDKISHAYLFSGPRGTGKTSTAKIISRMINCDNLSVDGVPCGQCKSCLNFDSSSDVVEIDAASNNGVDEIRELRDKVNLVPTYGKYKVYIIDEVHMLTTAAFNALLKTLEEPPAHVIFILATTEFYKIPATIVSRCQKFQFFKFSNEDIVQRLKDIALKESISVNDDVLFEVARLSEGGLRDAINMLDQLSSFKADNMTVEDVYNLNGVVSYIEIRDLLYFVHSNQVVEMINFIDKIDKNGKDISRFIEELINFLKDILIYKNTTFLKETFGDKKQIIIELADLYSLDDLYRFIILLNDLFAKVKVSSFGKILLITELIKFASSFSDNIEEYGSKSKSEILENVDSKEKKKQNGIEFNQNEKMQVNKYDLNDGYANNRILFTDKMKKIRINNAFATASKNLKESFLKKWSLVEEKVSNDTNYMVLAGLITDIKVLVVGEHNIIFLAQYPSLLERLILQIEVIERLLEDIFQNHYKIVFLLEDEWNYERGNYINNVNLGKKYHYIPESSDDEFDSSNENNDNDKDIDKIISILGNDVISYK